jgi:hypothetical protein
MSQATIYNDGDDGRIHLRVTRMQGKEKIDETLLCAHNDGGFPLHEDMKPCDGFHIAAGQHLIVEAIVAENPDCPRCKECGQPVPEKEED